MATLVFSTVGTALGGPIGGAIGALIGQSFDKQLLGPTTRGPRLGNLAVQTSSYGTQIPRIYGSMRVAGSVIWSTDLIESSQSGAKGQPDVTYSYSVSMAVALSSRPISSVGRIWADGKLLRGADGDFKSSTTFRLYTGNEDQTVDPLIASIEGISNTSAHRGVALAVFENLELSDFGNRIPFLTFEVIADPQPPSASSILTDASGGAIACQADQSIVGYAAYGASVQSAVQPLVDCYGLDVFDDGSVIRSPLSASATPVTDDLLGNSADSQQQPRLKRDQLPARGIPASLRLTYYDPALDYQTGEARASAGDENGNEQQEELPAVLSAADAKSLAQQVLARSWASRDRLTLRLPPSFLDLEPGAELQLDIKPELWVVDTCTIDGFVIVAEAHPAWAAAVPISADSGRIVLNPDVQQGDLTLALLDVPDVLGQSSDRPALLLAASSSGAGWKRNPIELSFGGQTVAAATARAKSVLGTASTVLQSAETSLIDNCNSVTIRLIDQNQWLTSCDDDALAEGSNLAALGSELLQFGRATRIADGSWELSRLLRGRGGTEWATGAHSVGEVFCLIRSDNLIAITLPQWIIGSDVTATAATGAEATVTLSGESVRPPSPVNLSAQREQDGSMSVSWTRRSRGGFAWTAVDAPLGEGREEYNVTIAGTAGTIELVADQPAVNVSAQQLAVAGAGPATIEITQIGDWALSRAAQLTLTL